jgi:tol-pal system protein YbgF
LLAVLSGCAHARTEVTSSAQAEPKPDGVAALRAELAERDARLNQLENRLSLIEAEQRQHRLTLEGLENPVGLHETVRIGGDKPASEPNESTSFFSDADAASAKRREARPVLKLYEQHARAAQEEGALMPIPEVNERLPPFVPNASPGALAAPMPVPSAPGDPSAEYGRGIDLLRKREFDAALIAFNDFLVRYPGDPRAARVLFWRGEVLFAQRDYARALSAFETVLTKEPRGDKAADAWLKVALCHKRLGSTERARAAFERLKTQFPNSDAARLAAQEDA